MLRLRQSLFESQWLDPRSRLPRVGPAVDSIDGSGTCLESVRQPRSASFSCSTGSRSLRLGLKSGILSRWGKIGRGQRRSPNARG